MSKIYTRGGDFGETALFGGRRVAKDQPRIEAVGTLDELSAAVGVARAELARGAAPLEPVDDLLATVQHQLFDFGAELAAPDQHALGPDRLSDTQVAALEAAIDRFDAQLPPLTQFILPGGAPAAAQLHFARGVCRRAERRLVTLSAQEPVRGELLRYLNRFGDLLFVLARTANQAAGLADVKWRQQPHRTP